MAATNPEKIIWKPIGDVRPPNSVIQSGWLPGEQPPAEYENFMSNFYGKAVAFFVDNGIPNHDVATAYEDSAVVKYNKNIYIALQANQNAVPTEGGDANWSEVPSSARPIHWDNIAGKPTTFPPHRSAATVEGGLKSRLSGTTLYLTNDGTDA